MSSETFELREEDFKSLYEELRRKLDKQISRSNGEAKKKFVREVDRGIEEGNILIQEMEGEVRKAPPAFRIDLVSRVRSYRGDMEGLSRDLEKSKHMSEFGRSSGHGGYYDGDEFENMEDSQRSRLLQGTQSVNRASGSLVRSHQIAAETDEIGTGIIDELGQQRESLTRTRDRLHDTDVNLSKSRKILNTMAKRVMTNKLILTVIIFLELIILGAVIYVKFFKK